MKPQLIPVINNNYTIDFYYYLIAYFDPLHGNRLLTTAQNSQICLYDSHDWSTPTLVMHHAHRQFQHMTHIKVIKIIVWPRIFVFFTHNTLAFIAHF